MTYSRIHAQAFSEAHGDMPPAAVEHEGHEIVIPHHREHPHAKRWFVGLSALTIAVSMGGWFVFLRGQLHGLVQAVPATAQSLDFLGVAKDNLKTIGNDTISDAKADLGPETQAALVELKAATDRTILMGGVLDSMTTQINAETYAEETQNPTAEVTN